MSNIIVNAMGDQCPVPVVKTIKAIAAASEEELRAVLPQAAAQAVYDHFHKENLS